MEFSDRAAYEQYNAHPDHVRFVQERWLSEVTGAPRDRLHGAVASNGRPLQRSGMSPEQLGRFGGERLSRKPPSADDAEPDDRDRKEECGYGPEERDTAEYGSRDARPAPSHGRRSVSLMPATNRVTTVHQPARRSGPSCLGQCSGISPERPPTFWRLGRRGWFVDMVSGSARIAVLRREEARERRGSVLGSMRRTKQLSRVRIPAAHALPPDVEQRFSAQPDAVNEPSTTSQPPKSRWALR